MSRHRAVFDSALFCAALITRMNGNPLDRDSLRRRFEVEECDDAMLGLARILTTLGVRTKLVRKKIGRLKPEFFPVIAETASQDVLVLAAANPEEKTVLVQRATAVRAEWEDVKQLAKALSGRILLVKMGEQGTASERFGFGWFMSAALKYRGVLRDCILASLFVQIFGLVSPLMFMIVIDKVLSNNSLTTLDVLVFALVVVSAFEIMLNGLRSYLISHTAHRIDLTLGMRLFGHLLELPLSYFESRRVGDTVARMRELERVRGFITGSGIMLWLDLFFLMVFISVMFLFSRFLTMVVLMALPVVFGVSFIVTPLLRDKLEDSYSSRTRSQSFLVETISGIETIKGAAAEPSMRRTWERHLGEQARIGFAGGLLGTVIQQSTAIVSKTLTVLLLWFGAKEVLRGNLTVGQLIAFNMLSSRVIAPVLRLSQAWKEFEQVRISIGRIADIFKAPREPGFDPGRTPMPPLQGKISFCAVNFRYPQGTSEVLDDVSFEAAPGEVIGLIGSTGSGKTTLVKLLQRQYVPDRGKILIDGNDISLADSSWLRRQIGVVAQDGVLFDGTIRENITLGRPNTDIDTVMSAAELAGAHDFIAALPHGYDTPVGERGNRLSAGQRQRISLARALLGDPRLLILDEATSAMDYESERRIQDNMKKICAGRTVLIVAHRFSSVRHADRIITLENGRIVENGPPARLLTGGGRYADLHRIQEEGHVRSAHA